MIVYGNWPLLLIKSNSIRPFFFSKRKENIWSFQGGGHPLLNSHSFDIIDLQWSKFVRERSLGGPPRGIDLDHFNSKFRP